MRKLLIADGVVESAQTLQALFRDRCEVRTCADGESAMVLLREFAPDILVVDLMLPKTDGLSLLQAACGQAHRPQILVQTSFASPYIMARLAQLGVDYVMIKPCPVQALEARICDFLNQIRQIPPAFPADDQMIHSMLISLGFSPKLDGYDFLVQSLPIYARDPSQAIIKELYATVGKHRQKDVALVERSIRSAIDKAWRTGDPQVWRRYFCPGPDGLVPRPSNGTFMARMAQFLAASMPGKYLTR